MKLTTSFLAVDAISHFIIHNCAEPDETLPRIGLSLNHFNVGALASALVPLGE